MTGLKVGIDAIAMYTPRYVLDLNILANIRGVSANKFKEGLGQFAMSVPPPGEDIITMATNAASQVLEETERDKIDWVLFATESAVDLSKAAGIYLHDLLHLPKRCRVIELKQACYSATAAIQLALPYLRENPKSKILLIASDIARYGLATSGESSQGAGACAMVLSASPRIIAFDEGFGVMTENTMDFWRPIYLKEALVEGKYSSKLYLSMLEATWQQYIASVNRHFNDHHYFIYHTPVPRLVEKAHAHLLKINDLKELTDEFVNNQVAASLHYGRNIGNSYSASLYISFCSLLDFANEDLQHKRIGFYSYGSGCVAEFFSGVIQENYQQFLKTSFHHDLMKERIPLTYDEYVALYEYRYAEDGNEQCVPFYRTGKYRLAKVKDHKRHYEEVQGQ